MGAEKLSWRLTEIEAVSDYWAGKMVMIIEI